MKFNKNHWHLFALVAILVLTLLVRLYFVDWNGEVDVSDEGEYMVMTQSFAKGEIVFQWPYYRPFLLPLLWGLMLRFGLGEIAIRVTLILFSLGSVFLTYLIGKDLFNRKAGLIAAFFMVLFPDEILNSTRVLLNSAALTVFLLSLYVFQKAYFADIGEKFKIFSREFNKSNTLLYLSALFAGLAILIYNQSIVLLGFYFLFLLINHGVDFIKEIKHILFFVISIGIYCLNFLYSYIWFENPIKMFVYGLWLSLVDTNSRNYFSVVLAFLEYLPKYVTWVLIPFLAIAFIILFFSLLKIIRLLNKRILVKPFLLNLLFVIIFLIVKSFILPNNFIDIKIKVLFYFISTLVAFIFCLIFIYLFRHSFNEISNKLNDKQRKYLFLIIWIFVGFFIVAMMVGNFQARYFIQALVPFFIFIGLIFSKVFDKVCNIKRILVWILFVLICCIYLILSLNYTQTLVANYKVEFGSNEVGSWINSHTNTTDTLVGDLNYALVYYSNRNGFRYPMSGTFEQNNYSEFLLKLQKIKPKYLVLVYNETRSLNNQIYAEYLSKNQYNLDLVYSYGVDVQIYHIKNY